MALTVYFYIMMEDELIQTYVNPYLQSLLPSKKTSC